MTTLGEMSAGIAHELNQPLNAIKIGNDYLKATLDGGAAPSAEDLARVIKTVNDQVQRASGIINRLREFGRKPDFKKGLVSVNTVLRAVLDLIGQQLALQNIEIRTELSDSLPPILANQNRLEQVFFNLLTNARDAIEQSGRNEKDRARRRITLSTFEKNEMVVVTLQDTGIGIPEGSLDKIFEPFYTPKEVGKGMGLGLAITYRIVSDFGGTIYAESVPGRGTCFTLGFPQASP
jgi:C4-dicarboxylate-specific signal transduction histidine kinase